MEARTAITPLVFISKRSPVTSIMQYIKYPRTPHLPWSEHATANDRLITDLSGFFCRRVIVTEKMDGENFTGYRDHCYARSIDGRSHHTRDWVKNFWMQKSHMLPEGWRVCGENMFAVHSIKYTNLKSLLLAFSIWNDQNVCLSWDETKLIFELLEIQTVDVLYDGIWSEDIIKSLYTESKRNTSEGYVVRIADSFHYNDFSRYVGKFVRKNHVATTDHWMYDRAMTMNQISEG
jgi:hypothetical protein